MTKHTNHKWSYEGHGKAQVCTCPIVTWARSLPSWDGGTE